MADALHVFISATSGDLGTVREIVKQGLLTMRCMPVEQTNFTPDHRTVSEMLEARIRECDAVIHLVGLRYGAAPDPASLPADVEQTHTNLNDQTLAGLKHKTDPMFSVQYHPEASPGPHDSHYLFKDFRKMMEEFKK